MSLKMAQRDSKRQKIKNSLSMNQTSRWCTRICLLPPTNTLAVPLAEPMFISCYHFVTMRIVGRFAAVSGVCLLVANRRSPECVPSWVWEKALGSGRGWGPGATGIEDYGAGLG